VTLYTLNILVVEWVPLMLCVRAVLGSHPDLETGYPNWGSCGVPQSPQSKAGILPQNRPWPLPSRSFLIHYSPIIWCYIVWLSKVLQLLTFWTLSIVLLEIGTSSIEGAQLSRPFTWGQSESSFQSVVLKNNRMMDNLQKVNCIKILSLWNFRSYFQNCC
jgi:hypothetical protein